MLWKDVVEPVTHARCELVGKVCSHKVSVCGKRVVPFRGIANTLGYLDLYAVDIILVVHHVDLMSLKSVSVEVARHGISARR